jgi:PAS domain-containing protein
MEDDYLVGANIVDLFPEARDMALAMHARARAGHRVQVPRHAPIGGTLVGLQETTRRIAERDRLLQERERALERLRVATRAARLGIYDFDVASGTIHWDERVRELWEIAPDEPVTYETFMEGVHPDDRASTQAAVDAASDPRGAGHFSPTGAGRVRRTRPSHASRSAPAQCALPSPVNGRPVSSASPRCTTAPSCTRTALRSSGAAREAASSPRPATRRR